MYGVVIAMRGESLICVKACSREGREGLQEKHMARMGIGWLITCSRSCDVFFFSPAAPENLGRVLFFPFRFVLCCVFFRPACV